MRKILLRTFWTLLLLAVLGLSTVLGLAYWYKPVALEEVEKVWKQHYAGSVRYKWSSFGVFKKWGELTLSLYQVQVLPATPINARDGSVAHMAQIHFSFDLSVLWSRAYKVKQIRIEELDAKTTFWEGWNLPKTEGQLALNEILIEKARFDFRLASPQNILSLDCETVALQFENQNLQRFELTAQLPKCQYIQEKRNFWELRQIALKSEVGYDASKKTWQFNETNIKVRGANFAVRGSCTLKENSTALDFRFRGKDENLQTLLAFLPAGYYEEVGGYKTKGKIALQGSIQGEIGKDKTPTFEATFGGDGLQIVSPHSPETSITDGILAGKIDAGAIRITDLEGKLGAQRFRGTMLLQNWAKPHLVVTTEAGFDLSLLHEFYPLPAWESLKGLAGLKLHIDADIAEILKTTAEPKKYLATGELELINVSAKPQEGKPHNKLNAKIVLQNDFADIKNLQTQWGENDLTLKGKVQNWLACLFSNEQILHGRGELKAKFVQLADFIKPSLALPANVHGQIRVSIDSLAYQRLQARNIQGDFALKDKILRSGNLTLQIAEGTMSFLGILNAQKENFMTLDGRMMLKNAQAGKIWYAFHNFGQKILQDKQLTGKLDADVRSGLVFDKNLTLKLNHAVCDAELTFTNGELKDVQILDDLAQKVQIPDLKTLPFKEMHALLQLRNQTLFVPEWNVTGNYSLGLVGRATTEKGLDFRLRLQPKRNLVYHINWTGNTNNFALSFPPETEQPHLEANWTREKETYLKIFKRNTAHESVKMDTMKMGE